MAKLQLHRLHILQVLNNDNCQYSLHGAGIAFHKDAGSCSKCKQIGPDMIVDACKRAKRRQQMMHVLCGQTCLRRVTLLDMPVGVCTLSQTARLGTTSGRRS